MKFKSALQKIIALFQRAYEWVRPKAAGYQAAHDDMRAAPSSRKKPPLRRTANRKKRGTPRTNKRLSKETGGSK